MRNTTNRFMTTVLKKVILIQKVKMRSFAINLKRMKNMREFNRQLCFFKCSFRILNQQRKKQVIIYYVFVTTQKLFILSNTNEYRFICFLKYLDEGDPKFKCEFCDAIMWYGERINKKRNPKKPIFSLCCGQGQVKLPLLKESPEILKKLLNGNDQISKYFRENIRALNMLFSFTSLGGKVERTAGKGRGPPMFQLHGENYHLMGSLKPPHGDSAKFSQLYIVDTENEVDIRDSMIG